MAKCAPGCTCGRHKFRAMPLEVRERISKTKRRRFLNSDRRDWVPSKKQCSTCHKWKLVPEDFSMCRKRLASGIVKRYPDSQCKSCVAKRVREWEKKHPDRAREMSREQAAVKRRKNGQKARGASAKYREKGKGGRIPIKPLSVWLSAQISRSSIREVASKTGYDEAHIRRLLRRRQGGKVMKKVSVEVADRIFVRLGHPEQMAVLYPLG